MTVGTVTTILACFIAVSLAPVKGETIQLEPTQGILIPAPVAESLRFARAAYGGYAAPPPASYPAPAPAAPSYSPAPAPPSYSAPAAPAPSYSPASIPAPPCPKNYLFSCQPSLAPVPCAAPSYSGSYSHVVPQYAPLVKELY